MGKILIIKDADFSAVAVTTVTPLGKIHINVISSPTAGGIITGDGFYDEGEQVVISAIPNVGYDFLLWEDGNTDASRTIIVGNQDAIYTALFVEVLSFKNSDLLTLIGYFLKVDNNNQLSAEASTTGGWRYGICKLPNNTNSIYIEELVGTNGTSQSINHCPVVAFLNGSTLSDFIIGSEIYGQTTSGGGLYKFTGTVQVPNNATYVAFSSIYAGSEHAADMDAIITFN